MELTIMKEFNMLCREFEEMDPGTYFSMLDNLAADIIPALRCVSFDGVTGEEAFGRFVLGAIVSDGKLSEDEYNLIYPMLEHFFGEDVDFDYAKRLLKENKTVNKQLKEDADRMVDVLGLLSDDLKNDIVLVCLMICAVDGKVGLREKNWIKKLIKE